MTILRNTFEGGTNGAQLTLTNSALSGDALTNIIVDTVVSNTGSPAVTYVNSPIVEGSLAIRMAQQANPTYIRWDDTQTGNRFVVRRGIYLTTSPTANNAVVVQVRNSSTVIAQISISIDRTIRIFNSTSSVPGSASPALSLNTIYWLEMAMTKETGSGSSDDGIIELRVTDNTGTVLHNYTLTGANTGILNATQYRFGQPSGAAWGTYDYIDGIAAGPLDSGWISTDTEWSGGTLPTVLGTTPTVSGDYMEFASGSTDNYAVWPGLLTNQWSARFYAILPSSWAASPWSIVQMLEGANINAQVSIAGTGNPGQYRLVSASNTQIAASINNYLRLSTEYRFEVQVDRIAQTFRSAVFLPGTDVPFYDTGTMTTINTGAAAFTQLRIGKIISGTTVGALKIGRVQLINQVGGWIGRHANDPLAPFSYSWDLATGGDIPTVSIASAIASAAPTIVGSPGWLREKRIGVAETAAGGAQTSTANLDINGSTYFAYPGLPSSSGASSNPGQYVTSDMKPGGTPQSAYWLFNLDFETSSPTIELRINSATAAPYLHIRVNGKRISQESTIFSTSVGAGYAIKLTFGSAQYRRITLHGLNSMLGRFGGVAVEAGYTVFKPTATPAKTIAFIGDTYANGVGGGLGGARSTETFVWKLGSLLGAGVIIQAGIGGTGWNAVLSGEPTSNFAGRISSVLAMNPDTLITVGGRSDTASGLQAGVESYIDAVGTEVEHHIVRSNSSTTVTAAILAATASRGASFINLNIDSYAKYSDGVSLTLAAHEQFAQDIYDIIRPYTPPSRDTWLGGHLVSGLWLNGEQYVIASDE